jgi:hypothetical protein
MSDAYALSVDIVIDTICNSTRKLACLTPKVSTEVTTTVTLYSTSYKELMPKLVATS